MRQSLSHRLDYLVSDFGLWVRLYDANTVDPGHVETISQLRGLGVGNAIGDTGYVRSLNTTLSKWLAYRPLPKPSDAALEAALAPLRQDLLGLEGEALDDPHLDREVVGGKVFNVISAVASALGKPHLPLVLGSKAIHHVLPDLVPPIDNVTTAWFFTWGEGAASSTRAQATFMQAFEALHEVALRADPRRYVTGRGWRTSLSKVLDNALEGYRRG